MLCSKIGHYGYQVLSTLLLLPLISIYACIDFHLPGKELCVLTTSLATFRFSVARDAVFTFHHRNPMRRYPTPPHVVLSKESMSGSVTSTTDQAGNVRHRLTSWGLRWAKLTSDGPEDLCSHGYRYILLCQI